MKIKCWGWHADVKKQKADDANNVDTSNIQAQNFTFRELAIATKNFRQECLMGEGGFGRVYKGTIPATGQVIHITSPSIFSAEKTNKFNLYIFSRLHVSCVFCSPI